MKLFKRIFTPDGENLDQVFEYGHLLEKLRVYFDQRQDPLIEFRLGKEPGLKKITKMYLQAKVMSGQHYDVHMIDKSINSITPIDGFTVPEDRCYLRAYRDHDSSDEFTMLISK